MEELERVAVETYRLLSVSGYKGMLFLNFYLQPFRRAALNAGVSPAQIDNMVERVIDDYCAQHSKDGWIS